MSLSRDLRLLLAQSAIFTIIMNYITIFINLYIFEQNHSISQVAWFNLIMILFWSPSFALAGYLFSRTSNRIVIRIASIAAAIMFLFLLFLHVSPMLWYFCIGGSFGIMCGTYYNAQNITLTSIGKGKDFEAFFSLNNMIGQTIGVVNPILSAFLIKWFGYSSSFLVMFLFVCVLFLLTFMIPNVTLSDQMESDPLRNSIFKGMQSKFGLKQFKWLFVSSIICGIVIQFQGLFSQLFTFQISDNKLIIAGLNVAYTILTMLALWMSKKVSFSSKMWLRLGGTVFILGCLLVLHPTKLLLIFSNVLTLLGYFFFINNWNSQQFIFISKFQPLSITRVMIGREISINIGRASMLALMVPIHQFHGFIYTMIIIFSVTAVLVLFKIQEQMLNSKILAPSIPANTKTVQS